MYCGSVGRSAFIQGALWISEQCYGMCQLVGSLVPLSVVDIVIVGWYIPSMMIISFVSQYVLSMSLNFKNSQFSSPMTSKVLPCCKLWKGITSINPLIGNWSFMWSKMCISYNKWYDRCKFYAGVPGYKCQGSNIHGSFSTLRSRVEVISSHSRLIYKVISSYI